MVKKQAKALDEFHKDSHFELCANLSRCSARIRAIRELIILYDLSIALKMEGKARAFICAEEKGNRGENEKYLRKEW